MSDHGYYRYPTVHGDAVVFVSDDDLWSVSIGGGRAARLTSGLGSSSHPRFSPDGSRIAFSADDEGVREVYALDAEGGVPTRLTWDGGTALVQAWTPDGAEVVYASNAERPHLKDVRLRAVGAGGGASRDLGVGLAAGVALGADGVSVICRHQEDIARWKRYRGGRVGSLWLHRAGDAAWRRVPTPDGNVAAPMWIDGRVWFVADHDYDGNLYSCRPDGTDLVQHTHHRGHFVRWPSTDGRHVVYAHAGDLHALDPRTGDSRPIPIRFRSPRTQTQRRFVPTPPYVQDVSLHPEGHSLVVVARGKPFVLGDWEGPVRQLGQLQGARYRLARYLPDGERVLVVSDAGGEEAFEIHELPLTAGNPPATPVSRPREVPLTAGNPPATPVSPRDGAGDQAGRVQRLEGLDIGRPHFVAVNPVRPVVAFGNQRQELVLLDLQQRSLTVLDQTDGGRIPDAEWSACGTWLTWARPEPGARSGARIRLHDLRSNATCDATDGKYLDSSPSFDPDGQFLYFLSHRAFDPVYDSHYFDLAFPRGVRPYLITLRAEVTDPFRPGPRRLDKRPADKRISRETVEIDVEGLSERIVPFPLPDGRYTRIIGLPGGQALVGREPVSGSLDRKMYDPGPPKSDVELSLWSFAEEELQSVCTNVTDFGVDLSRSTLLVSAGWRVRVTVAAPDKGQREEMRKNHAGRPGRRSGWIDLGRIRAEVDPRAEWRQILRETWRLMRDQFWTPSMSGVDWNEVWDRYHPLVDRVCTRGELSDLVWAMQGELGTSHAYEMGGDYRARPHYAVGSLGADLRWSEEAGGYTVTRIVRGEAGDPQRSSPLAHPGVDAAVGDVILAIGGRPLSPTTPPGQVLAGQSGLDVELTLRRGERVHPVTVRALTDPQPLAYREWVLANRRRVHQETDGRVGYVHVPDMGPAGYAEFHRDYLSECERLGLVVDVRYNGGGHVSQLILEKLARRRVGYTVSRYRTPRAYPAHSVLGPMVCITNEMAGSDGDIFSHVWKLLELGPLVGTRTWGGVIGIWPRHNLVDKTLVTQPEFSHWFEDVRFAVENAGTQPDVEVDIAPHDYRDGVDPQLDRALALIGEALAAEAPALPEFGELPHLGR